MITYSFQTYIAHIKKTGIYEGSEGKRIDLKTGKILSIRLIKYTEQNRKLEIKTCLHTSLIHTTSVKVFLQLCRC